MSEIRHAPTTRHSPVASTGTRRLAAGAGIDAHRHDDHQIVYASRGVLSVTTDAGVWVAPATRAIWVPAGTRHEHRAYGHTVLHTIGLPVTVNPLRASGPTVIAVGALLRELLIAYAGDADGTGDGGAEGDRTGGDGAAGSRTGGDGTAGSRTGGDGMAGDCARDDGTEGDGTEGGTGATGAGGRGPARARLRAVLLDQLRRAPERPLHVPSPVDARLAELHVLLAGNPAGRDTLDRLAARIGSSPRTLSRLCRTELGMTFPQWRTQLRLHHALRLLAEGLPVSTVAHRCGWAGPSAFIDVFRRALGYTPGGRHRQPA